MRTLSAIGYEGPVSGEWEDSGMHREHGAPEALRHLRALSFPPAEQAFDASFESE